MTVYPRVDGDNDINCVPGVPIIFQIGITSLLKGSEMSAQMRALVRQTEWDWWLDWYCPLTDES